MTVTPGGVFSAPTRKADFCVFYRGAKKKNMGGGGQKTALVKIFEVNLGLHGKEKAINAFETFLL